MEVKNRNSAVSAQSAVFVTADRTAYDVRYSTPSAGHSYIGGADRRRPLCMSVLKIF